MLLQYLFSSRKRPYVKGNTSISQYRAPEPWVYSTWREGDMKKGEPLYVQIKAGSPAPDFTI